MKTLKEVLEYHVISGSVVFSTDIKNEKVKSLGGQDLTLTVKDGELSLLMNAALLLLLYLRQLRTKYHWTSRLTKKSTDTIFVDTAKVIIPK